MFIDVSVQTIETRTYRVEVGDDFDVTVDPANTNLEPEAWPQVDGEIHAYEVVAIDAVLIAEFTDES